MKRRSPNEPEEIGSREEIGTLVNRVLQEAGVSEAVEAYEKAEAAYARVASLSAPLEFAASSTSETLIEAE